MISILGYQFEGPYHEATTNFNEVAAIYVVLDENYSKVDVGETDKLKSRLIGHERRSCWERNCGSEDNIYIASRVEDNIERRLRIEKEIRSYFNFPCGKE